MYIKYSTVLFVAYTDIMFAIDNKTHRLKFGNSQEICINFRFTFIVHKHNDNAEMIRPHCCGDDDDG